MRPRQALFHLHVHTEEKESKSSLKDQEECTLGVRRLFIKIISSNPGFIFLRLS